jgi:Protein of unknown function (DUF3489)
MNVITRQLPPKDNSEMTTSPERPKKAAVASATKPRVAKRGAQAAPLKAKRARKAARVKNPSPASHGGNKTARILDLLKRAGGVSLKELMEETGWQPHSVRGFLSGVIGKKMGTPVESFKSDEGERCYRMPVK